MESIGLLAIVTCILLTAAISRRIKGTIFTLPMIYTVLGILLGSLFLDLFPLLLEGGVVELISKLTLVIVLATDASRIDVQGIFRDHNLPMRLLAIGLPLTMIFGTIAAVLIFTDLNVWEAVVLGVILSPTDASLGQSVVSNPKVPLRVRQALNIESGLNDGIALPFLLLAISVAQSELIYHRPAQFIVSVGIQIGIGIVVGLVLGYLGVKYVRWGATSGWMSRNFQKITSLALILFVYGLADLVGGNGFIAAFCLGLASRNVAGEKESENLYDFAEAELTVFMLLTFILFGAVVVPPAVRAIDLNIVFYAILSLTIVRLIPVAISLVGTKIQPVTTLFLGWFGPRGIASILYIFIVLEAENISGSNLIYNVVVVTVLLSIFVHGFTAAPGAAYYGKLMAKFAEEDHHHIERKEVPEMPLRVHH